MLRAVARPPAWTYTFRTRHIRFLSSSHTSLPKQTFESLLIANRGEIACRIIETARRLGIRTVAVYTALDAAARHVQLADEAYELGADPQGYLSIEKMLQAVRRSGAVAVHPGYGFLSENPAFVRALDAQGVTFVGPSAEAIAAMGDKIQSKAIARASGVHCIPGYDAGEVCTVDEAQEAAHAIGYPVMIKASAGGGGKGMRIAWNDRELTDGFKLAKQEARSAFGDDRLLIEKYIHQPRHIEIQVIGDRYGNVVYLPERECSIQRRNQKVIEESPSVHLDSETRRNMGLQAVALAKHVGYSSAGTVEFLVDSERNFYFLEMNTRLQVEHPITEYVTGLDLVEHMLYSAAGYPLSIRQEDVMEPRGWAMESRVYAEDPTRYLPSVGRLRTYREPPCSVDIGVRCDSGIREGSDIPVEYDPLLCKLATHGNTRQEAIDKMVDALDQYVIQGVTHNIPLLRSVYMHPKFRSGKEITTHFLAEEYPDGYQSQALAETELWRLTAINAAMWAKNEIKTWVTCRCPREWSSIWVQMQDEHSGRVYEAQVEIKSMDGGDDDKYEISSASFGKLELSLNWPLNGLLARASIDGEPSILQFLSRHALGFNVLYQGSTYKVSVLSDEQRALLKHMKQKAQDTVSQTIVSPMPGRVVSVAVQEGDKVVQGAEVAVVEAMKMQNILRSSRLGTIKRVHVQPGSAVRTGQLLIEFEK